MAFKFEKKMRKYDITDTAQKVMQYLVGSDMWRDVFIVKATFAMTGQRFINIEWTDESITHLRFQV